MGIEMIFFLSNPNKINDVLYVLTVMMMILSAGIVCPSSN